MKTIKAKIEGNRKTGFNVYLPDSPLPFGLFGEGDTEKEAVADFKALYEEMKADYERTSGKKLDYQFDFSYDVPTLLEHYRGYLTLAGLQRITGINQMQLSQYLNGVRNPTAKTVSKIESSIHSFGQELCKISLL